MQHQNKLKNKLKKKKKKKLFRCTQLKAFSSVCSQTAQATAPVHVLPLTSSAVSMATPADYRTLIRPHFSPTTRSTGPPRAVSEQSRSNFRAVPEQFQSSVPCWWNRFACILLTEQFQSSFRAVSEQFQSNFRAVPEQCQKIVESF